MTDNKNIIAACENLISEGHARSFASIAKKCGKTSQYFTDLRSGKARYSRQFLDILCREYPVNKDFVLTGKGSAIINRYADYSQGNDVLNESKPTYRSDILMDLIKEKDARIEELNRRIGALENELNHKLNNSNNANSNLKI